MESSKIDLTKRFVQDYLEKLCNPSPEDIVHALIGDGITNEKRLRNYMICHEFQVKLIENGGCVGETYNELAIEFDMSSRQVERIVQVWRENFNIKHLKIA